LWICREFGLGVLVGHAGDAAEDFAEVDGFDVDAGGGEHFFGVADGVEGGRAGADGADAGLAEAVGHAADGGEPGEVATEEVGLGFDGVAGGEGVGDADLLEVVADAHLAAEGVAAVGDGHAGGVVGGGLNEDGDIEPGGFEDLGDGAFIAEVGEGDDDAVDFVAIFGEQIGAEAGFGAGFDGAVLGLFGGDGDDGVAGGLRGRGSFLRVRTGRGDRGKSRDCRR
jgi:hypothetical protein